jgi:hypothetical protein
VNSLAISDVKINPDLWIKLGINGIMLEVIDDDMLKDDLEIKSKILRKFIFKQI